VLPALRCFSHLCRRNLVLRESLLAAQGCQPCRLWVTRDQGPTSGMPTRATRKRRAPGPRVSPVPAFRKARSGPRARRDNRRGRAPPRSATATSAADNRSRRCKGSSRGIRRRSSACGRAPPASVGTRLRARPVGARAHHGVIGDKRPDVDRAHQDDAARGERRRRAVLVVVAGLGRPARHANRPPRPEIVDGDQRAELADDHVEVIVDRRGFQGADRPCDLLGVGMREAELRIALRARTPES
jgi:hypothetical protein